MSLTLASYIPVSAKLFLQTAALLFGNCLIKKHGSSMKAGHQVPGHEDVFKGMQ